MRKKQTSRLLIIFAPSCLVGITCGIGLRSEDETQTEGGGSSSKSKLSTFFAGIKSSFTKSGSSRRNSETETVEPSPPAVVDLPPSELRKLQMAAGQKRSANRNSTGTLVCEFALADPENEWVKKWEDAPANSSDKEDAESEILKILR